MFQKVKWLGLNPLNETKRRERQIKVWKSSVRIREFFPITRIGMIPANWADAGFHRVKKEVPQNFLAENFAYI